MNSLGGTALKWMFESAARAGRLVPQARAQLADVEVLRDIPYANGGQDHLLDVYRHAYTDGTRPALLYLHGGAFRILSKDTHWLMASTLARAGFIVFNANYRLAPMNKYPCALEDAASAFRWVVEHAHAYGADASKLVIAGESAGANLTLGLGLATCFRRAELPSVFDVGVVPKALAPMCGILQVTDGARLIRRKPHMRRIVADRILETERGYLEGVTLCDLALANPLLLLESALEPERPLPAVYSAVGTADPLLDDTRRLEAALKRRGVPAKVSYFPKELHAFHALVWRGAARECWREQIEFLREKIAAS